MVSTLKKRAGLFLLLPLVHPCFCLQAGNTLGTKAKLAAGGAVAALAAYGWARGTQAGTDASAHQADMMRGHGLYGPILGEDSFDEGARIVDAFPALPRDLEGLGDMACDGRTLQVINSRQLNASKFKVEVFHAVLHQYRSQFEAWAAEAAEQARGQKERLEESRLVSSGPGGTGLGAQADLKRMELDCRVSEAVGELLERTHSVLLAHQEATTPAQIRSLEADLNQVLPLFVALEREHTHNLVGKKIDEINLMLAMQQKADLLKRRSACPREDGGNRLQALAEANAALREDIVAAARRSVQMETAMERLMGMSDALTEVIKGGGEPPESSQIWGGRVMAGFPDEDPRRSPR